MSSMRRTHYRLSFFKQLNGFFVAVLVLSGLVVFLRDELIAISSKSDVAESLTRRVLAALPASTSGIQACSLVDNTINIGSEKKRWTDTALSFFQTIRPENLLLQPLKVDTQEAWESYRISLLPLLFPFLAVGIVWLCIWISCLGQMLCSKCCSCCSRDLYKKPYSARSIFVWMLLTLILFVVSAAAASFALYYVEQTYQGFQQLYCQQQLAFKGFLEGKPVSLVNQDDHWIGMNAFSNNIEEVQKTLKANMNEFLLAFDLQKSFSSYATDKAALKALLQTLFDTVATATIPDPFPATPSNLNLKDFIVLNGASGFTAANAQILSQYESLIEAISSQLTQLHDLAQLLDNSSSTFSQQIANSKTNIDTFNKEFLLAQALTVDLLEQGNSWILKYRLVVIVMMSVILFCCSVTFITFPAIYFYKVKSLEIVTSTIWIITSIVVIAGLYAAGSMYMTTNIFYEASISINTIFADQSTFLNVAFILDPGSAKYLVPCLFGAKDVSIAQAFGLTEYLNKVNQLSEFMVSLESSIGRTPFPQLVLQKQIESGESYLSFIDTLVSQEVAKKLDLLNKCTNSNQCDCQDGNAPVSCSSQILQDYFVFSESKCASDGVQRFKLAKGQENTNYSFANCIVIHVDSTQDIDYSTRISNRAAAIDTSTSCQKLQTCTLTHLQRLQTYASQSGASIQAVQDKLKQAETSLLNLYSTYITLHEDLSTKYKSLLYQKFSLVSSAGTGMQTNLQCSTFGSDLRNAANFLFNQYLSTLFLMQWLVIGVISIMILGLTAKYISIARLQFWAHFDLESEQERESSNLGTPLFKSLPKWLFGPKTPLIIEKSTKINDTQTAEPMLTNESSISSSNVAGRKGEQKISNDDSLNSSRSTPSLLKSILISQSAYQKKFEKTPEPFPSISQFNYQLTLSDLSLSEENPPKKMQTAQFTQNNNNSTYTRSQYELEMQEYHS